MACETLTMSRLKVLRTDYGVVVVLAIAAGLAGLLAALIVSLWQQPQFRVTTSISMRPMEVDLGVAEAADRLANNVANWIPSEAFAAQLTNAEAGGLIPIAIANRTKSRALPKQMRLIIEVEDHSAERAALLANGLARVAVESAIGSVGTGTLEISQISPARVPLMPISPCMAIILPAGLILGMVVGIVLGFLYRWLQEPVRGQTR